MPAAFKCLQLQVIMDPVADNPLQGLQKAAVCAICLEYFADPVSIDCGHTFCRACITQYCADSRRRFCCPHCRRRACKRDFRPNRELADMVDLAKRLKLQAEKAAGGCEKHQEPLKLFCEDDQTLICVVCDRSKEHRTHSVLPLEEAVQDYKEQIQSQSQSLKQEREKLEELKQTGEKTTEEYLGKLDAEMKKLTSEFELLHLFLEKIKQQLLDQLNELELEIKERQKENDTKFSEEFSILEDLISEMEQMCKGPTEEFLQDVKKILSRCKKKPFHVSLEIPPDLNEKLSILAENNTCFAEILKKFKDTLLFGLQERDEFPAAAKLTLDVDTAGPYLILSENGKSVKLGDTRQNRANSRDRFNVYPCVLGREGFTSGRHRWEVEVVRGGCWAVGVARESVKRKKKLDFRPEEGIWALEHVGGDNYRALTSPPTPLPLSKTCQRVRVRLDYEKGEVTFFDTKNNEWIFTFPSISFAGETVYPWLWVGLGSKLRLCP